MNKTFTKNLLLFLIPTIVPLLIIFAFSLSFINSNIYENIKTNNSNILTQAQQNIELILSEMDSIYINFATNPSITSTLSKLMISNEFNYYELKNFNIIESFIDSEVFSSAYVESIYIYFDKYPERALTTFNGIENLNNFIDTSWLDSYNTHKETQAQWYELRNVASLTDFYSNDVITGYRTFLGSTAQSRGVIVLNVSVEYMQNLLNTLDIPENQVIFLESNGEVLFSNKSFQGNTLNDIIGSLNKQPENFFEYSIDGVTYVISRKYSQAYGFNFYSAIPKSELYQLPMHLTVIMVAVCICLLIFAILWILYINKMQYKRLDNIIKILDAFNSSTDLQEHEHTTKNDEYGYITNKLIEQYMISKYANLQLSEKKYKLKYLELATLQSQINPHMLYNTLESVAWKGYELTNSSNNVTIMLEDLSKLLRYSLHNPKNAVSIGEEIDNTISYIKLQQVRYQDKFKVVWDFEENILSYTVCRLVLQPLIENAIYHGIKDNNNTHLIKIHVFLRNERLYFRVFNSGTGMSKTRLLQVRKKLSDEHSADNSIGLFNVHKRLLLMHNTGITIRSKPKLGTSITFNIPAIPFKD